MITLKLRNISFLNWKLVTFSHMSLDTLSD
jgi:hypothetical protein